MQTSEPKADEGGFLSAVGREELPEYDKAEWD
jgi:hypothetical protein